MSWFNLLAIAFICAVFFVGGVTLVWCCIEWTRIRINTARERKAMKARNYHVGRDVLANIISFKGRR